MAHLRSNGWRLYLACAGVLTLAYLPPGSPLHSPLLFNAIGLSAAVAILVGQRLHRPSHRTPWRLFAAAQALFVTGDVLAYNYSRFFHAELPFPSIADAFYLSVYPLLIVGLVILVKRRTAARDAGPLIDSLI